MIAAAFQPTEKQLRQFAWAAPIGLALVGFFVRRLGGADWWPWAGLGLGLLMLAVGLARPTALRLPFALAMLVAAPIGWVVSNVFLAAFFFLFLTPLALFFRLIGRDALGVRKAAGATAWSVRRPAGDAASYYRQG